ncbi:nitronate monooxygenase [Nakamurella sp.]|uniref:nitronate monooxygenase n=1 Tax=Nakamurella sp. TaxID=1869182 RepID=UPI003B3A1E49
MIRIGDLALDLPVLAAPMAGGPTTPDLVVAAAGAGGLGFLAGGYRTPAQLAEQIRTVRAGTAAFGVNLFAPHPVRVDPAAYAGYARDLAPVAGRFGVTLPARPVEDDDGWPDKIALLCSEPVPLVGVTFGLPPAGAVRDLHRAGSAVAQTVTTPAEARLAQDAGVDLLVVQGAGAGGHSAVFDPVPAAAPPHTLVDTVRAVRAATRLPLVAAGGLATAADVAAVRRAGATAVAVGTALLLADEAGTSEGHRRAIAEHSGPTRVTRAFTGRPARALVNEFVTRFEASAPLGYPAVHHLTGPLRRAAAAAGDREWVHLWAGAGHRSARSGPTAEILARLAV